MNDVERPSTATNGGREDAVGWDEAARILGWKVETLRKRTAARTVPHIREGKSITFLPSVLREWMVDRSLASLREQHTPATAPVTRKRRINL